MSAEMTTPQAGPLDAKEWRYSICYGPDGEENYAFVMDDKGQLVGNLRIHHAMALVEGMNALASRPAVEATAPALPPNVYYSREHGNFYAIDTHKGQGVPFWREWKDRALEFPGDPRLAASRPAVEAGAVACSACEDKPAAPNDPCCLCGASSAPSPSPAGDEVQGAIAEELDRAEKVLDYAGYSRLASAVFKAAALLRSIYSTSSEGQS